MLPRTDFILKAIPFWQHIGSTQCFMSNITGPKARKECIVKLQLALIRWNEIDVGREFSKSNRITVSHNHPSTSSENFNGKHVASWIGTWFFHVKKKNTKWTKPVKRSNGKINVSESRVKFYTPLVVAAICVVRVGSFIAAIHSDNKVIMANVENNDEIINEEATRFCTCNTSMNSVIIRAQHKQQKWE